MVAKRVPIDSWFIPVAVVRNADNQILAIKDYFNLWLVTGLNLCTAMRRINRIQHSLAEACARVRVESITSQEPKNPLAVEPDLWWPTSVIALRSYHSLPRLSRCEELNRVVTFGTRFVVEKCSSMGHSSTGNVRVCRCPKRKDGCPIDNVGHDRGNGFSIQTLRMTKTKNLRRAKSLPCSTPTLFPLTLPLPDIGSSDVCG
jgi:hypothetical protein